MEEKLKVKASLLVKVEYYANVKDVEMPADVFREMMAEKQPVKDDIIPMSQEFYQWMSDNVHEKDAITKGFRILYVNALLDDTEEQL